MIRRTWTSLLFQALAMFTTICRNFDAIKPPFSQMYFYGFKTLFQPRERTIHRKVRNKCSLEQIGAEMNITGHMDKTRKIAYYEFFTEISQGCF